MSSSSCLSYFCLCFSILSQFLSVSPCLFSPCLIFLLFFFSCFLYNMFCFHLVSHLASPFLPFLSLMFVSCNLAFPSHLQFSCLIFLILPLSFLFLVSSSCIIFTVLFLCLMSSLFFNSCLILSFFLSLCLILSLFSTCLILFGVSFSYTFFLISSPLVSSLPFLFSSHNLFPFLYFLSHILFSSFSQLFSLLQFLLHLISSFHLILSLMFVSAPQFPFSHLDLLLSHVDSSFLFPSLFSFIFSSFSKLVFCFSISFHNFIFSNHQPFL